MKNISSDDRIAIARDLAGLRERHTGGSTDKRVVARVLGAIVLRRIGSDALAAAAVLKKTTPMLGQRQTNLIAPNRGTPFQRIESMGALLQTVDESSPLGEEVHLFVKQFSGPTQRRVTITIPSLEGLDQAAIARKAIVIFKNKASFPRSDHQTISKLFLSIHDPVASRAIGQLMTAIVNQSDQTTVRAEAIAALERLCPKI